MDALHRQLTDALRRLSEQSERERTAQAEACQKQVETLRRQVERLSAQVTSLTEHYAALAESLRARWR